MLLNNALELNLPDGFLEMSREETAGFLITDRGEGIALKDKERHLIVTAGWKKIGGFSGMILNQNDLRKKMERDIRNSLAKLNYKEAGPSDRQVGGLTAEGFQYQYTAVDGTEMTGESYVLKKDYTLYYFHLYSRRELASENSGLFKTVLMNAHWVD